MGFILTVITTMLALDAIWATYADRLLRTVRRPRTWRAVNATFLALQALSLLWIFLGRLSESLPAPPKLVVAMALVWHLVVLPLTAVLLALPAIPLAVIRAAGSLWRRLTNALIASPPPSHELPKELQPHPSITRRAFLRTAAVMAPPLLTTVGAVASLPQLSRFRVRPLELFLPALPASLDGMTIAHVSDIHVGRLTRGPILDAIVRTTNDLHADLVLLTGDLINDSLDDLNDALALVKNIDPRRGLAMCEGNHDLLESRAAFERRTRASGIPLLINETTTVRVRDEPVQLLGLRWGPATRTGARRENGGDVAIASSMDATLRQLRGDAFPILLAHHPHAFDPAAAAGIPLTLAGHTHGGQLMLTDTLGCGPAMYRYWSGPYEQGDARLVVSNGVGNWFPLRINAPAEIIHITLRRGG
jgi:uncharacterized protein